MICRSLSGIKLESSDGDVHTDCVVVGVGSSLFSGELSHEELTDGDDSMDRSPKLETFPDSFCSSGSLSESCVVSSSEIDAVWFKSLSSTSSTSSLSTVQSKVCVSGVSSSLLDFPEEAVLSLPLCLSFVWRQGEAAAGGTRRFTGDELLSEVRSITAFSFEDAGRLRLRKPSRGPRPLTKGGPLCTRIGDDSFSLSPSGTSGSGQACAQGRLGGWFSLGSGFRRLNGRRAASRIKTNKLRTVSS